MTTTGLTLMPSTCEPVVLQCPHGHERARFRRDRKYSVRKQSMRSKKIIKNVYTHKCQLPVLMKPIMLMLVVSQTLSVTLPLFGLISRSVQVQGQEGDNLQLLPHGRVYVFISFFLYSLFQSLFSPLFQFMNFKQAL